MTPGNKPRYLPSEEEIAREREEINAAWDEKKRERRRVAIDRIPWIVPVLTAEGGSEP